METVDISALMSTSGKGILYTAAKRFAVEMMNSACNGSAILNCNGIGGDLAPDLCILYMMVEYKRILFFLFFFYLKITRKEFRWMSPYLEES